MRDVGLVGVPLCGKSTLFTALTRRGAAGGRANQAVVTVEDPRLEVVAALARSKRAVPAQIRFVDVPGGIASAQGVAQMREADALCVVLRAFGPDADPAREHARVRDELVLADLAVVEPSLDKARKHARGARTPPLDVRALEAAHEVLSAGVLLRDAPLDPDAEKHLRTLAPLTTKPWVVVANLEEGTRLPDGLPEGAVGVWAEIEAETAGMPEHEARALLDEFGVHEPGLQSVIDASYRALDIVTFFTANEDEARAWQGRHGSTAPEAAGLVHTDMQRGFIRTEVANVDELAAAGGWDAAKHKGLVRVEGKDYVVRDGDVLLVRFAV